jgi:hypothetical protein
MASHGLTVIPALSRPRFLYHETELKNASLVARRSGVHLRGISAIFNFTTKLTGTSMWSASEVPRIRFNTVTAFYLPQICAHFDGEGRRVWQYSGQAQSDVYLFDGILVVPLPHITTTAER